ncbi:MAG TPA: hypothetical protein VEY10_14590 [Flavisolibacter sp.]|nr:hypothetical protein [Flavisolibacter sp.]
MQKILMLLSLTLPVFGVQAQQPARAWKEIGTLKTLAAKDIKSSTWSIGGETLDRNYTDYHSYKKYLGPLGAKRIRLQGGWSKCEKVKGQYSFAWLDSVVKDAHSQSVSPWVELSYGNPIYEGGGEARLAGALPTSTEALSAWDAWVKAMINRYKNELTEWEIWNEPDLAGAAKITGDQYADFYIRTAEVIRKLQPDAKLMAFGLAGVQRIEFAESLFKKLKEQNKINLVDIFTYHGYSPVPEKSYPAIEKLRQMVWGYAPGVVFMQGENGAPSTPKAVTIGAMRDYDWSELTQAKWNLRRMLGDHGRGIATNLFTISDIHYEPGDHMVGVNTKGLLKTNPDKTIERPKLSYKAAQHVFTLFDGDVKPDSNVKVQSSGANQSYFGYAHKKSGFSMVTIWQSEDRPADNYEVNETTVTMEGGSFKKPVFVDMINGKVYEIPKGLWKKEGSKIVFNEVPVPDYPVAIADKSILRLK